MTWALRSGLSIEKLNMCALKSSLIWIVPHLQWGISVTFISHSNSVIKFKMWAPLDVISEVFCAWLKMKNIVNKYDFFSFISFTFCIFCYCNNLCLAQDLYIYLSSFWNSFYLANIWTFFIVPRLGEIPILFILIILCIKKRKYICESCIKYCNFANYLSHPLYALTS